MVSNGVDLLPGLNFVVNCLAVSGNCVHCMKFHYLTDLEKISGAMTVNSYLNRSFQYLHETFG